jgi:hypothetical protein
MSEPPKPMQASADRNSTSGSDEGPVRDPAEIKIAPAEAGPFVDRAASGAERAAPSPGETVSTLVDQAGAAPEEVLDETIADAGGVLRTDSTDSATFQLVPPDPTESIPDGKEDAASPQLGQVAGYKILRVLGQGGMGVVYAWTQADPKNVSAESYSSEALLWLGVTDSHLGDLQTARQHFDQALQICTKLAAQHPRHVSFKGDLASVFGEQGAALARGGQHDEAEKAFSPSLAYSRVVLERDPEDAAQELLKTNAGRPAVLVTLARCFAACAAGGTNGVDRRRARGLALDGLDAAIRNGYRDQVAIRTDPDFAPLLSEPELNKLVDGLKP